MISDFLRGLFSYTDAISYIRRNHLQKYYLYSGLIGLIVLAIVLIGWRFISPTISEWLLSFIETDISFIEKAVDVIVYIATLILFFIVYKYLVLVLTSPLMSQLSEKVESQMDNDFISAPLTIKKIIIDLKRSLSLSFRNIIKEVFYSIGILLLGVLPLVTITSAPFILLIQGYFAGFGNMDYYLERYFDSKETVIYVKDNRALATGNGVAYILILAIPVIGVFFAPVLGTVAATLEVHKRIHS